ncbi:Holin of 3TMs, for gene-transfer release OS=Bosea thiooxidans OX=53254 GN=SAMN05660750_03309 PE=4 SV=1 [Bosea thiooxidans]
MRGWFYTAWRPAGMWPFWLCGRLPCPAPFFRITVPMADLVAFTGLYLTLYMGGHTAKEWFSAHYAGRRP